MGGGGTLDGMEVPESVYDATVKAVGAAKHLKPIHLGAVAALLQQAKLVDAMVERGGLKSNGDTDTTTVGVYLRYCNDLGLTPSAQAAMNAKKNVQPPEEPQTGGLTSLQLGVA